MKHYRLVLAVLCISIQVLCVSALHASVLWDESVDGDFSNVLETPTDLNTLSPGINDINGSIGAYWTSDSADVVRFTVPTGYQLSQFILTSYEDGAEYDYVPVSLHSGPTLHDPTVESMLLSEASAGTDLLQFDSMPGPQPAGVYSFWFGSIEQSGGLDERSLYTVTLNIEPAPPDWGAASIVPSDHSATWNYLALFLIPMGTILAFRTLRMKR